MVICLQKALKVLYKLLIIPDCSFAGLCISSFLSATCKTAPRDWRMILSTLFPWLSLVICVLGHPATWKRKFTVLSFI